METNFFVGSITFVFRGCHFHRKIEVVYSKVFLVGLREYAKEKNENPGREMSVFNHPSELSAQSIISDVSSILLMSKLNSHS